MLANAIREKKILAKKPRIFSWDLPVISPSSSRHFGLNGKCESCLWTVIESLSYSSHSLRVAQFILEREVRNLVTKVLSLRHLNLALLSYNSIHKHTNNPRESLQGLNWDYRKNDRGKGGGRVVLIIGFHTSILCQF